MYKFLLAFGVFTGYCLILYLARKEKLEVFTVASSLFVFSLIISFLAKISGYFFYGGSWKTLFSTRGETTVFGCIFFVLFLYYVSTISKNERLKALIPLFVIYLLTIQAFGKIGCHFAGCCYGIPGNNFLCFVSPSVYSKYYLSGVKLFPIQLVESFFFFLFLTLLLYIFFKMPSKRKLIPFYYLVYYSVHRFLSEFLRSDYPPVLFSLKIGQILAIITFILTFFNRYLTKQQIHIKS